ncbi:MAG TPA: Smr/MutS family protein [Verrucomicrobiae bacterium]|nr:Smr/MutS family protein [Verrucomicrobiae bacterium]
MESSGDGAFPEGPVRMPITGELDLHSFRPQDLGELIPDYIEECRAKGIYKIRIVHGKGIGNVRRSVEAILARHPDVQSFAQASEQMGGWGATIVMLKGK